jgi:hypothetical protein
LSIWPILIAGVLDGCEFILTIVDQVVKIPPVVFAAPSLKFLRFYVLGAVFDAEDHDPIWI